MKEITQFPTVYYGGQKYLEADGLSHHLDLVAKAFSDKGAQTLADVLLRLAITMRTVDLTEDESTPVAVLPALLRKRPHHRR